MPRKVVKRAPATVASARTRVRTVKGAGRTNAARGTPKVTVEPAASATVTAFENRLLDALRQHLRRQLPSIASSDRDLSSLDAPETIAASMATLLPASHPFDPAIGPFYDTAGLTTWLGVTRQRLHQRVRTHSLLACPTEEGHSVYPVWQFQSSGAPLPGLPEVLATLAEGTADTWQVALWLSTANTRLNGAAPRTWLTQGRGAGPVLRLAKETAQRWRR